MGRSREEWVTGAWVYQSSVDHWMGTFSVGVWMEPDLHRGLIQGNISEATGNIQTVSDPRHGARSLFVQGRDAESVQGA